jgi:hypothetical protein
MNLRIYVKNLGTLGRYLWRKGICQTRAEAGFGSYCEILTIYVQLCTMPFLFHTSSLLVSSSFAPISSCEADTVLIYEEVGILYK